MSKIAGLLMACFSSTARFWGACFREAFTLPPDGAPHCYNAFPEAGEPSLGVPDTRRDDVASDLFYAKLKVAGVVILGVVASTLLVGGIALVAASIIEFTAEIFVAFALVSVEWIGESIIATLASILALALLGGSVSYEIFTGLATLVASVSMLWSKVMIPNIQRGFTYFQHQNQLLRTLDLQRVPVPAI